MSGERERRVMWMGWESERKVMEKEGGGGGDVEIEGNKGGGTENENGKRREGRGEGKRVGGTCKKGD